MDKSLKRGRIICLIFLVLGFLSLFFDMPMALFFRSMQNPLLNNIFLPFESIWIMVLIACLLIVLIIVEHKRKLVLPFALTLVIATLTSFLIKFIVMRPRPFGLIETITFTNIIDFSFPSSHTVFIFSALPLLNKEFPKFKMAFITLALLIGLSRIYFRVHYMSDIFFGALIGYLIGQGVLVLKEKYLIKKNKKR